MKTSSRRYARSAVRVLPAAMRPRAAHSCPLKVEHSPLLYRVPQQLRYVTVEIGGGNPGATGVLWQVAQQTSLRNVTILAGAGGHKVVGSSSLALNRRLHLSLHPLCLRGTMSSSRLTTLALHRRPLLPLAGGAAVGLDMAFPDYVHWNGRGGVPAAYNLGGGGVVTDVAVVGGGTGIRTAASQVRVVVWLNAVMRSCHASKRCAAAGAGAPSCRV
jgi:hypothetical protein